MRTIAQGPFHIWHVVETLVQDKNCNPNLRRAVDTVINICPKERSIMLSYKFQLFICYCLKYVVFLVLISISYQKLGELISAIFSQTRVIKYFYDSKSLWLNEQKRDKAIGYLNSISQLPLQIDLQKIKP